MIPHPGRVFAKSDHGAHGVPRSGRTMEATALRLWKKAQTEKGFSVGDLPAAANQRTNEADRKIKP